MFEDSLDAFVARFRPFAATVELFSHLEGSPLLECRTGDTVFQVLERTGPYLSSPGPSHVIVNPTTAALELRPSGIRHVESTGLGRLRAEGIVLDRDDLFAVIDAGVTLVVCVHGGVEEAVAVGSWVAFDSEAPVHAFVLSAAQRTPAQRDANGHG